MVTKTVAKYGEWESEISVEAATAGSLALTSPRSDVSEVTDASPEDTAGCMFAVLPHAFGRK